MIRRMRIKRMKEGDRYSAYLRRLDMRNPGASRIHKAVVEEIRKCAIKSRQKKTPMARMKAQIACAKQIPKRMIEKGFRLNGLRSSVYRKKRR